MTPWARARTRLAWNSVRRRNHRCSRRWADAVFEGWRLSIPVHTLRSPSRLNVTVIPLVLRCKNLSHHECLGRNSDWAVRCHLEFCDRVFFLLGHTACRLRLSLQHARQPSCRFKRGRESRSLILWCEIHDWTAYCGRSGRCDILGCTVNLIHVNCLQSGRREKADHKS